MSQLKATFICLILCLGVSSTYCEIIGKATNDFKLVDVTGTEHSLFTYLEQGKSVILNFSSTWCKPCWNYENTGIMERVYETFGPMGTSEVVILFIEADPSTCEDCLYGQEECNDFTYGNWTEKNYPTISLKGPGLELNNQYRIDRFPSIVGISAKDYTISLLGQLSFSNWNSWISQQSDKFRFAFIERVEAQKARKQYFRNKIINKSKPSIAVAPLKVKMDVFPNPCSEILNIDVENSTELLDFSLFNNKGQLIKNNIPRKLPKGKSSIAIDHLKPGMYFARIKSGESEIVKKVLVIQ